jgi:hypothetical protein
MFDYFKYRHKLYQINRKLDKIDKLYEKDFKRLKKEKNKEEFERVLAEWSGVAAEYETEKEIVQTKYFMRIAYRLNVHSPDILNPELWEESYWGKHLSDKARFELNKAIRQEKKERREGWVQIVTLFIGLVGTFIGLVSVWNK